MWRRSFAWWLGAVVGGTAAMAIAVWPVRQSSAATEAESGSRQPVLVELFTSEGCSSCPPADVLLAKLDQLQPIPGAKLIVLSEHVTYWDHQGWRDPYSLDSVTDRQKWYQDKFGLNDVYTPQLIVDGAAQMTGTDIDKVASALKAAAAAPKLEVAIGDATLTGDEVRFSVHGPDAMLGKSKQMLIAAVAEDETETSVKSGENAGKTLHNVAVVRVLKEINAGTQSELMLKMPSGKDNSATEPMRLVVFLVDKHSGHVLGAAEQAIAR